MTSWDTTKRVRSWHGHCNYTIKEKGPNNSDSRKRRFRNLRL